MNILTFDIEEWALAKAGGWGTPERYAEFDAYMEKILDALDQRDIKATFFCTGLMAEGFPQVVKLIQSRGHEIGCHSYHHTWMNKMSEDEAREDTHAAVTALEQCIGQKVLSYRAPAFSIGENNKWMFEILAENGITNDASIYPAVRDFGGFPGFGAKSPCYVEYKGFRIKEFPICTTTIFGKEMAYSGGGYFRFFPLSFVRKEMKESKYSMTYFHIDDLLPELSGVKSKEEYESYYKEPSSLKKRYMRYFKANVGKKQAYNKLCKLIGQESFVNIGEATKMINWDEVSIITL